MALAFQSHSYLTPCSKAHGGPVRPAHVPPRAVLGRRGVLDGPGWRILCASGFLPAGLHSLRARRKTQLTSRLPATRRLAEQGGPPAGEQEAFEELAEWLRSRGAYINKAVGLTDSDRDGQRGCVATTEIRVGELLLEIPVSCCLSVVPNAYDVVFDAELLEAMELAGLRKEDAELALAVGVERQEGEGSAWWPYLRLLSCKHTFPLFYEDTDLEDLENIPLKESLSVTRRAVELLAEKSGLEATELKEALQLVLGRRFSCEVSTGMIPLGDLLNHRFYPSCEWESPSTASPESWKLRAKMDIAPGETLNFAYCEDPNHLLMTTSGFVVEENPYDRIMARPKDLREALASVCNAQSNEDFAQWRKQQFKEQLPDPEEEGVGLSMYLVGRQPGGIQWNDSWLNLVGLAVTEDPQGQHWSATPEGLQMYLDALEKASWSLFPRGRLEEDLAKGDDFKSDNQEMAATMRRGYKQMLKEAVEKLKDRLLAG